MAWVKASPVEHYENFPVASWLCPPALRAPIAAIYHFARTADDIADEGDASADCRLADLAAYRAELMACAAADVAAGSADAPSKPATRWPQVFVPLADAIAQHRLPLNLLADLLSAFEQDVRKTDAGETYRNRDELLHYCTRSANPVGRLLLHLWGIDDERSLQQSDTICTALQLINFWQDLGRDIARGRHYLCDADLAAHGIRRSTVTPGADTPATQALVADLLRWAVTLMHQGAPLALRVPAQAGWRAGWELRLVVQGGLRVAERIAQGGHRSLSQRPTVGKADLPVLLWRAWRMRG
ncbi:MAG: squalene synthase HpnC [Burkholderiaceae bacterium]